MSDVIQVENITVDYNGVVALHDASLRVRRGTICALVGTNGAGKSTLFKAMIGFLQPALGQVLVAGAPVAVAQKQGKLAYLPQAEEVDWNFPISVGDVVMMGRYGFMNALRIPRPADREAVARSLERVGMAELRQRQIGALSGGQRKRTFLARALAQQAEIMLLDEPFTGIDAKTEETLTGLLGNLRDEGHTIVICTHNLAAVPSFCDDVAFINRTVLAAGPVATTFTAEHIAQAFGGVFNHLALSGLAVQQPAGVHGGGN